jgi:hypothetical protein
MFAAAMASLDMSDLLDLRPPRDAAGAMGIVRARTASTRLMVWVFCTLGVLAPAVAFGYTAYAGEGLNRAVGGAVCVGIMAAIVCTPIVLFWWLQRRDLMAFLQYGERIEGRVESSRMIRVPKGRAEALTVDYRIGDASHRARIQLLRPITAEPQFSPGDSHELLVRPDKPSLVASLHGSELVIGRASRMG